MNGASTTSNYDYFDDNLLSLVGPDPTQVMGGYRNDAMNGFGPDKPRSVR